MRTWLDISDDHLFGIHNLPYGVFCAAGDTARVGIRIGDHVLDAAAAAQATGFAGGQTWGSATLNDFLADPSAWGPAREWAQRVLSDPAQERAIRPHLHALADVTLQMPFTVGDYVDCYASQHHAMNVGRIFRPDSPALPVNWKHLPIGYHGRSQTVIPSGVDIVRPCGQRKGPQDPEPVFGPSIRLDIEAELGFVVGGRTAMGQPVGVDDAAGHIFGVVILNDWSARDIQAWEYVPLGPFLGKSFATSISTWVTPFAAFDEARCELPGQQDPVPLPYLRSDSGGVFGLEVHLEVTLNGTVVSRPEYRDMYWAPTQMLAHMTVNGASIAPGDLYGSGTISGPDKDTRGSFLELSWGGQEPFTLNDGATRSFLEDGDEVRMTAWSPGPDGSRIGISEVVTRILPATC